MTVIVFDANAKLSDTMFREIGRIVAHWSLLEYMMQLAIGRIAGIDIKTARILTDRVGTEGLLKKLALVAKVHALPRKPARQMERLIERIRTEQRHRNDVAHGLWGQHEKQWYLIRFKMPDQIIEGKSKQMTAKELGRNADRIQTLTNDFDRWRLSLPKP